MQLVVLLANVVGGNARSERVCWSQDQAEVDVLGLCVAQIFADLEHLGVANHLVDSAEAQLGHDSTKLVGDVVEEVDDVLRRALELLPELWILGCNTDRASVQVAVR